MSRPIVIKKFISFQEILLFSVFVLVLLVLFFPKQQIISSVLNNPVESSSQLIKSIIRVDPNENIRIALLQHYVEKGNYLSATKYLKNLKVNSKSSNFLYYASLKFKVLSNDYFSTNNYTQREIILNRINRLLYEVSMINRSQIKKYLAGKKKNNLEWMISAYRFEYSLKENAIALNLIKLYLLIYPKYAEQYYSEVVLLYSKLRDDRVVSNMLNSYIRSHSEYNKKISLFKEIFAQSIAEKDYKLTLLLIKIYQENFSNNSKIREFILKQTLRSGDPYFARDVVLKLQQGWYK